MARRISVEIVGDASSLERAFKKSSSASQRWGRDMRKVSRGSAVVSGAFGGMASAAGGATAALIGGAGVVYALKSTVAAAMESQRQLAQTRNAVVRSGQSWGAHAKQIDETLKAQSDLSAFDDERLSGTFANLVRRTGDVNEALRLNALAANVARGRNIELEQAQGLVLKASIGNVGALRRLGINISKNATATQALELLQRKYAGSASVYGRTAAGSMDRFRVAIENAQESIGKALLPKIAELSTQIADFLNDPDTQRGIEENAQKAADNIGKLAKAYKFLNRGGEQIQNTLEVIFETPLKQIPAVNHHLEKVRENMQGITSDAYAMGLGFSAALDEALKLKAAQRPTVAVPKAAGGTTKPKPGVAPTAATPFLSYQLALAEATSSRRDDERVLGQIINVLRARLGATKNLKAKTELREALNGYQGQLAGLLSDDAQTVKDATDAVKARKQAAREKAAEALQDLHDRLDKQLAAMQAFAIPGRLQVAEARAGALGKGEKNVARKIRDAAYAALHSGRLAVEGQIAAWNAIAAANNTLAKETTKAARIFGVKASPRSLLRGLGLSAAETRAVAARLARVSPAGMMAASSGGAFGVADVILDGQKVGQVVTSRQQVRARRNPPQKRGVIRYGI